MDPFWRTLLVLLLSACSSTNGLCDSWDCAGPKPIPICDSWDCDEPPKVEICDSWDCSEPPKGPGKERKPSKRWGDLLRRKCEGLPYRSYWDSNNYICVDIQPSEKACQILQATRGTEGLGYSVPSSVRYKLDALRITAPTTGPVKNCVWDFGLHCDNGTLVGDRCVLVVTNPDTLTSAGNNCKKQGFGLYVPHNDKDIQLLLVFLMSYSDPAYWIGVTNPTATWNFEDGTVADFFRWKFGRVFAKVSQGAQFQSTKVANHAYCGYYDVQPATGKAPYVCSRYANSDFYYPSPITTTTGGGGGSGSGSGESRSSNNGQIHGSWDSLEDSSKRRRSRGRNDQDRR